MSINPQIVHVFYNGRSEKIPMGRLAFKNRKILFEYSAAFLETGLELSPFKLPLKAGVLVCEEPVFEGLFGVFNDSLPDGWGRLLLDRKLMNLGRNPNELSPLERLSYVGQRGMGALTYEPEIKETSSHPENENLDEIFDEVLQFQNNDDDKFVDDLLAWNGSSAGARPKILVAIDGKEWIIKFRAPQDPKDIGPQEYAYHLMAQTAQLDVPEAKLFPSKKGPGYFGVRRFDHTPAKRHMHTISGLLHADHRLPSLDYETIMKATLYLTKDVRECEKLFRLAVFNVLSHNRDDHGKNFSFLMDGQGTWRVSPAYDLTFSAGPGGEHCTTVMGEGRNPTENHLLKLAKVASLKKENAQRIIDEVAQAVSQWPQLAKEAGVQKGSLDLVRKTLGKI